MITSPSSGTEVEYDGIINIILKPKAQKGISVDVEETLKLDLRSNDTYVGVTWGSDKVRLKMSYDNYYRANPFDIQQQRTDQLTDELYGKIGYSAKPFEMTHDIGLNLDYQITPRDFSISPPALSRFVLVKRLIIQPSISLTGSSTIFRRLTLVLPIGTGWVTIRYIIAIR